MKHLFVNEGRCYVLEEKKEKTLTDAWKEFMSSIRFLLETKSGKITLDMYMKNLSDFIDDYIRKEQEEETCEFKSGYVEVAFLGENVNFAIFLSFLGKGGGVIEKVLRKSVSSQQFTNSDLLQLQEEKKVYVVNAPEGK